MTKKFIIILTSIISSAAFCYFVGCTSDAGFRQDDNSQYVRLSIIGTNDLHGSLEVQGVVGGLPVFAGYLDAVRNARYKDNGAVLLVDAGDFLHGTLESNLTEGASVISAYNALAYDAVAIGNHEFDFGKRDNTVTSHTDRDRRGALKDRAIQAKFKFLAANLVESDSGTRVAWRNVAPSVMVEKSGIPIGIIGVLGKDALNQTLAANTVGLRITSPVESIVSEASRLKSEGAMVIVVLAHMGGSCKTFDDPNDLSTCDTSSEIFEVARSLPNGLIDVIVAGHTHTAVSHLHNDIAIIESYAQGQAFGRIDLLVDQSDGSVLVERIFPPQFICEFTGSQSRGDGCQSTDPDELADRTRVTYENQEVTPDAKISALIAPALTNARNRKLTPLGVTLREPIRLGENFESPLGNFVVDAMLRAIPTADVAVISTIGGLRADLPSGPLTYGNVFEMFPFDNRIVAFEVTGADLQNIFGAQLRRYYDKPVAISGIRVSVSCTERFPEVQLFRIDSGTRIQSTDRLVVITSDYLATNAHALFAELEEPHQVDFASDPPLVRDAIADGLKRYYSVIKEQMRVDAQPRWTYEGRLPVKCID